MVSPLLRLQYHTGLTHHTRWYSSGRVISPTQRPLPDKTQHSQQTDIHTLSWIQSSNPSRKRSTADPRLRTRGQWVQRKTPIPKVIMADDSCEQMRHLPFLFRTT